MKNKFITNVITQKKYLLFWVLGLFSFIWIVLRSGTSPKRLTYPCQQAAFPLASSWLIAISALSVGVFAERKWLWISGVFIVLVLLSWIITSSSRRAEVVSQGNFPIWKTADPLSNIYIFENIAPSPGSLAPGNASVPDAYLTDPAVDSLLTIMDSNGLYLYKTAQRPAGIVGANDIVIIKANFQWRGKLSTNTDRIKGVIWAILKHPDGFNGEIIIADNGSEQIQPSDYFCGITDYANNSDDPDQSILDVINVFKAKDYPVDYMIWDNLNNTIVPEYSENNFTSGYVYDPATKVNYPKFKSPRGAYISLKHGVWNTTTNNYDLNRLTLINMPVLKAHGMGGATIAVKNWIGVMNQIHNKDWYGGYDQFHYNYVFKEYALPSRVLDDIWPKLNIVDATYTAIRNNYEPGGPVIKTNAILASTDPVAVSWYAAKYILKPVAQFPSRVDPDKLRSGYYGTNLNHWYQYFRNHTSRVVTKDPSRISVYGNTAD